MKIYTQLHGNMVRAMESAGFTNDKEKAQRMGLKWAPDEFAFANYGDFEIAYYDLRSRDPANYSMWPDVPGGTSYVKWKHNVGGNLAQDYSEDMSSVNSVLEKWSSEWGIDIEEFE